MRKGKEKGKVGAPARKKQKTEERQLVGKGKARGKAAAAAAAAVVVISCCKRGSCCTCSYLAVGHLMGVA